jgi:glycosyltransferase involved in cell wall biosynthesis
MVTAANRFSYLQRSVQCYIDQTYPNKELVIINEGPSTYQEQIRQYIQTLQRQDIRFIQLRGVGEYTLGGLRNISFGFAEGDIYCQWDDDDFCMPQRLALQYSYMNNNNAKVCYLSDQLHYYFDSKELFWEDWMQYLSDGVKRFQLIPGTIMCRRDIEFKYPSSGKYCRAGEDSVFSDAILEDDPDSVALLHGYGYLHMYTFHTNNVFNLEHHRALSIYRSHFPHQIQQYREQICKTLNYLGLDQVKVMSREGVVFVYER